LIYVIIEPVNPCLNEGWPLSGAEMRTKIAIVGQGRGAEMAFTAGTLVCFTRIKAKRF
jgi:hypothetical protein